MPSWEERRNTADSTNQALWLIIGRVLSNVKTQVTPSRASGVKVKRSRLNVSTGGHISIGNVNLSWIICVNTSYNRSFIPYWLWNSIRGLVESDWCIHRFLFTHSQTSFSCFYSLPGRVACTPKTQLHGLEEARACWSRQTLEAMIFFLVEGKYEMGEKKKIMNIYLILRDGLEQLRHGHVCSHNPE